jgi:tripartite ATP-independent transporter DctM subunit
MEAVPTVPAAPDQTGMTNRLRRGLNVCLAGLAASWILGIMLLICVDVVMRSAFNRPISGVAEFVALSVVGCVFLMLPSLVAERRMLRAEMFIEPLEAHNPRAASLLNLTYSIVGILITWKIAAWTWPMLDKAWTEGDFAGVQGAYMIPIWPFKLALLVGAALGLLQFVWAAGENMRAMFFPPRGQPTERHAAGRHLSGVLGWLIAVACVAGMLAFTYLLFTSDLKPISVGIWCLSAMLVLVFLGMPIPLVLMGLSYVGIWVARGAEFNALNTLGLSSWSAVGSYEFGTIPLFIMMGIVLEKADVGQDAFKVAAALLGRLRGGLGMATVFANAIFASIVGSSVASAAVFTKIAVPPMVEQGYTRKFSVGCVAGSSVLGMLIPPSLLLIIYGLVAEESVGKLFIAAVIPGILLAVVFCLGIWLLARFRPDFVGHPRAGTGVEKLAMGEIMTKLAPILLLVLSVIGGIYGGFFTPTEAAAVGTFLAMLIALARGRLNGRVVKEILLETAKVSAVILFLIVAANLYTRQVALTGIPTSFANWVSGAGLGIIAFLAVYFLVIFLLGMIIDSVSIMLIVLPIMLPVLTTLGGDKIWFGIVTTIAIEIGLLTPPFGLSVYVVKSVLPKDYASLNTIFAGAFPFVVMMGFVTLIVMAFPILSLWLVR